MTRYGSADASRALTSIARGSASFETKAELEHHLLRLLRRSGLEGIWAFLSSLPEHRFERLGKHAVSEETRFFARGPDDAVRLVVTAYLGPHSASVNVDAEGDPAVDAVEPDFRHRAFYGLWETMLGLPDDAVDRLDEPHQAVFYVGLLEAEVMNGGLGQYLSNTGGVHVDATVRCLEEIGAPETALIVTRASELASTAESYAAAWEAKAEAFGKLDSQFLTTGEDLAGLTADQFLNRAEGSGSG